MEPSIKIITKTNYEKQNKKPNQKKVWDNIAKPWKTYRENKIPIVEDFLKDKTGLIVDLGCGSGRNMLPKKQTSYYGVDFSGEQLTHTKVYLKKNKIKAKLFQKKIHLLPKKIFKDSMFDAGLFIASLHCIEFDGQRKQALKQLHRILKTDAQALITVWNAKDKRFSSVKNHGPIYMSWKENNIPYMRFYYLFKKQELLALIKQTGFKILQVYKPGTDRFSKKNLIIRMKKIK